MLLIHSMHGTLIDWNWYYLGTRIFCAIQKDYEFVTKPSNSMCLKNIHSPSTNQYCRTLIRIYWNLSHQEKVDKKCAFNFKFAKIIFPHYIFRWSLIFKLCWSSDWKRSKFMSITILSPKLTWQNCVVALTTIIAITITCVSMICQDTRVVVKLYNNLRS